jgi:hypothetical protein
MPDPTYGVLHEEMKEFLKGRWNTWWRLRKKHYPPIKWVRSGVRPVNSPERRNAALCGILKHTENRPLHYMITAIEKISDPCKFYKFAENFLSTKDPLWENFTNFSSKREKPASLMGRNRILELTVNVLLPALFASGELRSSARLKKFAVEAWIALPPTQNNSILKIFEEKWFANKNKFRKTLNSAATRQGAIHIYRNFCEKNCGDCLSCPLRASLLPPENS